MEQNVLSRIIDYFFLESRFERDIKRASLQFFNVQSPKELIYISDPDGTEAWFTEWFLYDYTFANGERPLEYFVRNNPLRLSSEQLIVYTQLQQNHFSLFEVLSIKKESMIHVRDTQDGTEYHVSERIGTHDLHIGNLMYARVARLGDHWEFVGADPLRWDIKIGNFFRERLLNDVTRLSPKTVYEQMRDWSAEKVAQDKNRAINDPIDLQRAEQMLVEYLKTRGLEHMVTPDLIKSWIQKELDEELPPFSPYTILSGLVDPDNRSEEGMRMLVSILLSLRAHSQNKKKKLRSVSQSATPRIETIPMGGSLWYDYAEKARECLHRGKHRGALHAYNECFEAFLKEQTTMRDVYRIFANKAVAHMAVGDEYGARRFFEIALELNPNYDFALAYMRKLQSGELQKEIAQNALRDVIERLQNHENPWDRWDFIEIRNTWSEERILNELGTRGIIISKDEFRTKAKPYVAIDDFIKEQLQPFFQGVEEDIDLVYAAGYALWDRWCPDYHTPVHFFESIERLDTAIYETDEHDDIAREMEMLERFVHEASGDVFASCEKNAEYSMIATLVSCFTDLLRTSFHDRVLALARVFHERTAYLPFVLVGVSDAIMTRQKWQEQYAACMNEVGYDSFPFVLVGDVLCKEERFEDAQRVYYEGLTRVREREEKHAPQSVHDESLYDAYERVYNALEELYRRTKEREKKNEITVQKELLTKRKEELDRLDESAASATFDYQLAIDRLELFKEEQLQKDPALRYYEFLKKFSITFATKELTISQWSTFSYDGKEQKIGRNDPCPCGAGKKWKKCHGS